MPKLVEVHVSETEQAAPKGTTASSGPPVLEQLEAHRERMRASNVSVRQAAALLGIPTQQADRWVALADAGIAPYGAWLLGVQADVAAGREARAAELRAIVNKGVRGSPGHLIMMTRELGNPSGLDRELELIRRSRWYYATTDREVRATRERE